MILYYDCFSGISGDMNLGAMIDIGVPAEYLEKELEKLGLHGYQLEVMSDSRNGIEGTLVNVKLIDDHHHHRHLADIIKIIEGSRLGENVKQNSIDMFQRLAEAEATVHGKSVDEIHFHEVGAVDAIVDIVGAAVCFDYLSPEKIYCSPIELGSGMVKCEHGILPVPAPATAEILKGLPVTTGKQSFEATTPTGAVILACNVDVFSAQWDFMIQQTGYGIGHKQSEFPNVLRVFTVEMDELPDQGPGHSMLECNIDDMTPEQISYVMERLFEAGADDVFITPIIMKKSRNASKLSVLCDDEHFAEISSLLVSETSTLGFRTYIVDKTELEREFSELKTKYGMVRIKNGFFREQKIRQKPEYEDCARLAREHKVPLSEIYREVDRVLNGNG